MVICVIFCNVKKKTFKNLFHLIDCKCSCACISRLLIPYNSIFKLSWYAIFHKKSGTPQKFVVALMEKYLKQIFSMPFVLR